MNAKYTLVPGDWIRTVDDFDKLAPGSHFMTQHGSIYENTSTLFEELESKPLELFRRWLKNGFGFLAEPRIMEDKEIEELFLPAYVVMTKAASPFRNGIPPEARAAVIMNARDAASELDFGSVVRMWNGLLVEVVDIADHINSELPYSPRKMGLAIQGGDSISLADAVYPLIHLTPKGM